jgi:copper chaperone CopZ
MLDMKAKLLVLTAMLLVLAPGRAMAANAANSAPTAIRVKDMHCEACATRIRRKLFAVAGVVKVQTNVSANQAFVTPQRDRQPSPRAMWEAVEQAGFEPVKLEGPSGTFTSKPRK